MRKKGHNHSLQISSCFRYTLGFYFFRYLPLLHINFHSGGFSTGPCGWGWRRTGFIQEIKSNEKELFSCCWQDSWKGSFRLYCQVNEGCICSILQSMIAWTRSVKTPPNMNFRPLFDIWLKFIINNNKNNRRLKWKGREDECGKSKIEGKYFFVKIEMKSQLQF